MGVVLDGMRTKSTVKLPFTGASVEMWDYPLVGDITSGTAFNGLTPEIRPLEAIIRMIVSWDFTDKSGVTLPVNEENLKKIPASDFLIIARRVEQSTQSSRLTSEEKKVTPASSS